MPVPFYEFRCEDCGHQFSKNVSWIKKQFVECPRCGGRRLKEILGFNYKGPSGSIRDSSGSRGGCSPFG